MIPMELLDAVKGFGEAAKTIASKWAHKDY
jgi:hypothetical protein